MSTKRVSGFIFLGGILALGTCQAQTQPAAQESASSPNPAPEAPSTGVDPRTEFHIKYVGDGVVYLDGGRSAGVSEKMRLSVRRTMLTALPAAVVVPIGVVSDVVAELEVYSVADHSAVCEVKSSIAPLRKGDIATLNAEDAQISQIVRNSGSGRHYAQTISFTEGDPLDEEVREKIPHPPSPEVNRIRGRIGLDYNSIIDAGGTGANSHDVGISVRADMTRIGGTYWSLSGYSRFGVNSYAGSAQGTLDQLLNRTYHLTLTYDNPNSKWVAGFGRLYLPWATSLSTIDGGYVGRRLTKHVIVGLFAGSTPDPTSWNYNPQRRLLGSFINLEEGSYDGFHYTGTTGLALSRIGWRPDREFVFFENTLSWKRLISIYHELQADQVHANSQEAASASPGIAQSFLTLRLEPSKYFAVDFNENYFRDIPTFNVLLLGTGLLDKYLFQGLSGGGRVNLPFRATVYANIGRSSRTGDSQPSWNKMFGLGFRDVFHTGLQTDLHYTRFDSTFGKGDYKSFSVTRQLGETLRLMLQAGQQDFGSMFTSQTRSRFIASTIDWSFSAHYFVGGGLTVYRGGSQNYDQISFTVGWRFR
jgi:hypothetical protein